MLFYPTGAYLYILSDQIAPTGILELFTAIITIHSDIHFLSLPADFVWLQLYQLLLTFNQQL